MIIIFFRKSGSPFIGDGNENNGTSGRHATFHLVNALISLNSSVRRPSRRVSRLLRSSPTRSLSVFLDRLWDFCPAEAATRGRWNTDERKKERYAKFFLFVLPLPRASPFLTLSRSRLSSPCVSPGARFRHFRCHTPLSTLHPLQALYVCKDHVRQTRKHPNCWYNTGGLCLWRRRCPFIVGRPLYVCLHTATRDCSRRECKIGKRKIFKRESLFLFHLVYRVVFNFAI